MLISLREHVAMSFTLTFIAFAATAFYLLLERDRVPASFRTALRVSATYISIAAVNYLYMKQIYDAGVEQGQSLFPTSFRYIDWILTTPLMLLKFPLLLGVGERGRSFMTRLVVLDLVMIVCGYVGEVVPEPASVHWGFFLVGCVAWVAIAVQLFTALLELPEHITESVRRGVRTMGIFVVGGWAIYPLGYFAPLLGLPADVRELVYNVADLVNKVGLCMLVYATAKRAAAETGELPDGMVAGAAAE